MDDKIIIPIIIVGGMKCGTTSLRLLLSSSNEVYFENREAHYFDRDRGYDYDDYIRHIGPKDGEISVYQYVGDDTPTYSYLPEVATRIEKICPEAKIIWVLREPVSRAISNYWHAVRRGAEKRNINEAFSDEIHGRTCSKWLRYIERSSYSSQLYAYSELFPKSQILYLKFEDLVKGVPEEYGKLEDFLGIRLASHQLPLANSVQFFGRPSINHALRVIPDRVWILKAFNLVVRRAFRYRENVPTLRADIRGQVMKCLQDDMFQVRKITGISWV